MTVATAIQPHPRSHHLYEVTTDILVGRSAPLGATVEPDGVNFSLFSKHCEALELLLFDSEDDPQPSRTLWLDPKRHRTFCYWHAFVKGLKVGQVYAWRAHGPCNPERGHRFDGKKVLLDPYAKAVVGKTYRREAAARPGDNCAQALRSVVVDTSTYDWEGDRPLRLPYAKTVIYELHVGGFTRNPNSGVAPEKRGTYAGVIEKIPYLKDLGITAVELLPIHQFDKQDAPFNHHNYWGYSPIALFAPHRGYSSSQELLGPVNEFRDMIKALHRAGIEVILDVVFNHSAENDGDGPTLSFRGLANADYYILESDRSNYANYSGCGNTLNANHAVVRRLILDCLRYWVEEMHVDGFRFDLASVMSRDESGEPLDNPPILWAIESDPVLAGTKIIAEAWDAAGLYQVGSFVGDRFAEWNGPFRDDIRRFLKGDLGTVSPLAARILGSPDIYPCPNRDPHRSINFVTCHDGFTLNDLVSYSTKHNEANGEDNRDGANDNFSWNCGWEGSTDNPQIEALRLQQIKNFFTVLLLSQGTPMLLMGDEVRRTQLGNNNAYCQDNNLNWFDWEKPQKHADLHRFVRLTIALTQNLRSFQQEQPMAISTSSLNPHLLWHGVRLGEPDWHFDSHSLAFEVRHPICGEHLHVIFNAYWEPLTFQLPSLDSGISWHRIIDTAKPAPYDFCQPESAPTIVEQNYRVAARSSIVLMAF
jgi:glycogen operon protein